MKKELRQEISAKREALNLLTKSKLDFALNQSLEEMLGWINLPSEAKILAYFPLENKKEADLTPLLETMLENGNRLFFTRIQAEDLEVVEIKNWNDLKPSCFNLKEPCNTLSASSETDFDLILVPGVAFDKGCNRIGYGKGFYDKVLKKITGLKIGVAFDFQIIDKIEADEFDVKMDIILTDKGFYK